MGLSSIKTPTKYEYYLYYTLLVRHILAICNINNKKCKKIPPPQRIASLKGDGSGLIEKQYKRFIFTLKSI